MPRNEFRAKSEQPIEKNNQVNRW